MTVLMLAVALLVPIVAGIALVWLVSPRVTLRLSEVVFFVSLGIPVGLGLTSLLLFLWLSAMGGRTTGAPIMLGAVSALLAVAALLRRDRGGDPLDLPAGPQRTVRWLGASLALGLVVVLIVVVLTAVAAPHGGWDNWYIWNRHALFLFRGGEHWRDAFSAPEAGWAADYPLLTPGAIASAWLFFGRDSLLVSNAIALLFTLAPVGLVFSALSIVRSRTQGLLGAALLVLTPELATQGATQLADVPLATFYVAAVALACLHDAFDRDRRWLVMSGVAAGMAAWTKNEGLLFVLVFTLVRTAPVGLTSRRRESLRQLVAFGAGLLPVLAVVLYFKLRVVHAANDLVMSQTGTTELQRVLALGRYWLIAKTFVTQILGVGGWIVTLPALLLMYLLLAGVNTRPRDRVLISTGALTVATMIAGHFAVYVLTPHDLTWHLRTSLSRVLMQLWPTALLTFFLVARTVDEHLNDELIAESSPRVSGREEWVMQTFLPSRRLGLIRRRSREVRTRREPTS